MHSLSWWRGNALLRRHNHHLATRRTIGTRSAGVGEAVLSTDVWQPQMTIVEAKSASRTLKNPSFALIFLGGDFASRASRDSR